MPIVGVTAEELVNRLTASDLTPPPADTPSQLTTDGLSDEAATAFVATATAVAATDKEANSAAERFLFAQLNTHPPTAGLFRLNVELPFSHGKRPGETDLIAERQKVVDEIDGLYWHLNPEQYRRDRRKDWLYQTHGHLVLRVLAEDVVEEFPIILKPVADAGGRRTRPTRSKRSSCSTRRTSSRLRSGSRPRRGRWRACSSGRGRPAWASSWPPKAPRPGLPLP